MTADTRLILAIVVMFADACFATMAAGFGYDVWRGGSPITPELYGEQVYAIPALVWIGIQEKSALLAFGGAMMVASAGRWMRTGAICAAVGNGLLLTLFAVFCWLSADASMGRLMFYLCLCCGLPMTAAATAVSVSFALSLRPAPQSKPHAPRRA